MLQSRSCSVHELKSNSRAQNWSISFWVVGWGKSRRLGKVKDLQALLLSEWDEMNIAFILLETQSVFLGLTATLSRRRWNTRRVLVRNSGIVDVDLACFLDLAVKDLVLHTALKVRASSYRDTAVLTQYVLSTYWTSLRPFHTWLRLSSSPFFYGSHCTLCCCVTPCN
jgi:hypothetical protein